MSNEWDFPAADPVAVPKPTTDVVPRRLQPVSEWTTADAIVVIPGFMGTELIDTATGKLLWGLSPRMLTRFWMAPAKSLAPLAVHETDNTVVPGRLLRVPTFAPFLAGAEPYTRLLERLRSIVLHPSAILEFGYDWRLPVRHNAGLLAAAIDEHVRAWRIRSGRQDAKLCLVAHSMGGLLCHELTRISGAYDEVAVAVTLGTPFEGAAKAVLAIGSGQIGMPLPHRRLRELAVTMPGIYDLLPSYRCVDDGDSIRRLTPADIENIGGRGDLADAAFTARSARAATPIPAHRPMIGILQPTVSSVVIRSGCATGQFHTFDIDPTGAPVRDDKGSLVRLRGFGDGTVPRNSAVPAHHADPGTLPQQHGPIAQTDEAIAFAIDRILHRPTTARLGDTDLGLQLPEIACAGIEFEIGIAGTEDPDHARVYVSEVEGDEVISRPTATARDGGVVAMTTITDPGLYRISVAGGGTSAVTQTVMVVPKLADD